MLTHVQCRTKGICPGWQNCGRGGEKTGGDMSGVAKRLDEMCPVLRRREGICP